MTDHKRQIQLAEMLTRPLLNWAEKEGTKYKVDVWITDETLKLFLTEPEYFINEFSIDTSKVSYEQLLNKRVIPYLDKHKENIQKLQTILLKQNSLQEIREKKRREYLEKYDLKGGKFEHCGLPDCLVEVSFPNGSSYSFCNTTKEYKVVKGTKLKFLVKELKRLRKATKCISKEYPDIIKNKQELKKLFHILRQEKYLK